MQRLNKAHTLIETIVVIGIGVIIAAAATFRMGAYESIRLNAAARKLASDIRYAQALAMSQGNATNWYGVHTHDTQFSRYHIYLNDAGTIVTDPLKKEEMAVCFDEDTCTTGGTSWGYIEENYYPEFSGITLWRCCIGFELEFDNLGRPYTQRWVDPSYVRVTLEDWVNNWDSCWECPPPSGANQGAVIRLTSPRGLIKEIHIEPETGRVTIH